jgi:hypothetical protein
LLVAIAQGIDALPWVLTCASQRPQETAYHQREKTFPAQVSCLHTLPEWLRRSFPDLHNGLDMLALPTHAVQTGKTAYEMLCAITPQRPGLAVGKRAVQTGHGGRNPYLRAIRCFEQVDRSLATLTARDVVPNPHPGLLILASYACICVAPGESHLSNPAAAPGTQRIPSAPELSFRKRELDAPTHPTETTSRTRPALSRGYPRWHSGLQAFSLPLAPRPFLSARRRLCSLHCPLPGSRDAAMIYHNLIQPALLCLPITQRAARTRLR